MMDERSLQSYWLRLLLLFLIDALWDRTAHLGSCAYLFVIYSCFVAYAVETCYSALCFRHVLMFWWWIKPFLFVLSPCHCNEDECDNFILIVQVGIGHSFLHNATGWKWKLSTCLGGDGVSQIKNKTSIGLFPGFDLRIGWRAEYVLPEIHG